MLVLVSKNMVSEKSLGIGIGKIGLGKKSWYWSLHTVVTVSDLYCVGPSELLQRVCGPRDVIIHNTNLFFV